MSPVRAEQAAVLCALGHAESLARGSIQPLSKQCRNTYTYKYKYTHTYKEGVKRHSSTSYGGRKRKRHLTVSNAYDDTIQS